MDGLIIRNAAPADLPALVAMDREVRNRPDQPSHAAEWLDDPASFIGTWVAAGECVIAELGADPVGYAVLHYHFFHSGMIDMVIVRQPWRRKGVGRALIRHLAEQCTSPRIWISTNLSNTPMQALLASEGFAMSGFIEGLDEGDPELVYSRKI